jgi:hypothetical protein
MDSLTIERFIRWFEKDPGDALVGESELSKVSLSSLQKEFGVQPDNPMYDCFSVEPKHLDFLDKYCDVDIDLSKFDYFIEAESG